jgi:hypothetical protein
MDKRLPSTRSKMGWFLASLACLCLAVAAQTHAAVALSNAEAMRIGKKVWQNECNGSVAGLTSWNAGENFASLGIGHFIWYPKGVRGPFDESFPKYIAFALSAGVKLLPTIVTSNLEKGCPWQTREEFLAAESSTDMKGLREFLANTVVLQTQFLIARLENSLPKMLDEAAPAERKNVGEQFARVASTPRGCYALVDYVNFKGEGTLHTERYHDQGWGLLQVLENMHGQDNGRAALEEFSRSAANVLRRRVQNSPPERKEARWLPGWLNRVNSYPANS